MDSSVDSTVALSLFGPFLLPFKNEEPLEGSSLSECSIHDERELDDEMVTLPKNLGAFKAIVPGDERGDQLVISF